MKETKYISKPPNKDGFVSYSDDENSIWQDLYHNQIQVIQNRACDEYIKGVELLGMSENAIPQIPDINENLLELTGWEVYPVAALIDFQRFFELLADRKFPCATFIRTREEFEYLREPDIFHEIWGHCPMLTNKVYADFMHEYGKLGLSCNHKQRVMLSRLYWFTVEFGLIQTNDGLKIYGGGILSSPGETVFSVESDKPQRKPLKLIDAFRTPYRIDIYQNIYFVINSFQELFNVMEQDLLPIIGKAQELGLYEPTYPVKKN